MQITLAIESSCDETAVAILRGDKTETQILSSEISSQIDLHRQYGGVVPELASRTHSLTLRPLIEQALQKAGVALEDIDCYGATAGPGLASSLMIGHTAAKAMALATGKPFVSVNHMEGHLLSPFIETKTGILPNLALVVSGGHTMLLHTRAFDDYALIGKTRDDAAGEAFDKVAKMLGLPYPGGPEVEKAAKLGDPTTYAFPRSRITDAPYDFSFSGLKTAVLYTLSDLSPKDGQISQEQIPDICASFQQSVIDVLVKRTLLAADSLSCPLITLSGGVSCNQSLRDALQTACKTANKTLLVCSPSLSTDNAAMIAYITLHKHLRKQYSTLDCDIDPNLRLNTLVLRK